MTATLTAGAFVAFRRGSIPYQGGYRRGVVLSLDQPFAAFLRHQEALAALIGLEAGFNVAELDPELILPVVRITLPPGPAVAWIDVATPAADLEVIDPDGIALRN